jgi:glucosyl-3-phosphoglycerate synthase
VASRDRAAPGLTILVAARNEAERIAGTIAALHRDFPAAELIVVDGASDDATAERAEEAGAVVLRLGRRGKGEALSAGERAASPGPLLLVDADVSGNLRPLVDHRSDLAIAAFTRRIGGGFGLAKAVGRALIQGRTGRLTKEPLSGQRFVSERARAVVFPLAPGFGCEVRMTIDALRAGLRVEEVELDLDHRATGRDPAGFLHRGRQLLDAVLATGPLAVNHRGLRVPLVGWAVALGGLGAPRRTALAVAGIAALGIADDLWSGPERGWRAHLGAARTTGVLKLVGIPALGAAATGSAAGGLLVGLAANALNQLDTGPGRALKAFLAWALWLPGASGGSYAGVAVLLLPYDLRERSMLGDGGANALGAVVGLGLVRMLRGRALLPAIGVLGALNYLGETRSFSRLIDETPLLRRLDRLGRAP